MTPLNTMRNNSRKTHPKTMTIKHTTNKGIKFTIDAKLNECFKIIVQVTRTNRNIITKHTYTMYYGYGAILVPFDFNGLETQIRNTIEVMFHDIDHFKPEDMIGGNRCNHVREYRFHRITCTRTIQL
ncbi:C1 protein [Vernonia yellow vein betasatellite]|uniref:C1 protein n=1 Tax=Vernonia yellow vein betasatellite TaxID=666635 RepID=C9XIB2_9VIRU|nr:C1 protein [Vernonia yellow vein betasatellite]CBA18271.1 C1 protein [Vernonia yellow vein betasatellite]